MKKIFLMVLWIIVTLFLLYVGFIIFNYKTYNVFEYIFYIIMWLIFTFIFEYISYDICKNYNRESKIIKKYKKVNEPDLFNIEQLNGYKKIIKDNNGIILINEAGVFELRFIYGKGKLTGNTKDKYLKLNDKEISNPFKLDDSIKYFVLTKNILFQVSNVRLVTKTKIIFVLENYLNNKKYDKDMIDTLYNNIIKEVNYGNNKN